MAGFQLLWLLLVLEPRTGTGVARGTAEIMDPAQFTFSEQMEGISATKDEPDADASQSASAVADERGGESLSPSILLSGRVRVETISLPDLFTNRAVSVAVSSADASGVPRGSAEGAVTVIAQFN